jgi:Predicted phosphohydrolases
MQESFYTVPNCPVSIALAADLHERPYAAVLDSLRSRRPELICVAGDFLFGRPAVSKRKLWESGMLPFLSQCARLAPCFVSLGNHEWMLTAGDLALVGETGAQLLDNAYAVCALRGRRVVIGGLTSSLVSETRRLSKNGLTPLAAFDKVKYEYKRTPPQLGWLDAYCAEPGYHILLCHHPEYYPRFLREREIELVLSGHAHGGQIRLFGQGLFAPGQGILPRLTGGVTDKRLVISRGLANCQRVPRLFNPTELVFILPQM